MIRWKSTFILTLIFLMLSFFALNLINKKSDSYHNTVNILTYNKNFNEIIFETPSNKISCILKNDLWNVIDKKGITYDGDVITISNLINSLGKLKLVEIINIDETKFKIDDYGFNNSNYRLSLNSDDKNYWIIGKSIPFTSNNYIMKLGGKKIFSVSNDLIKLIPSEIIYLQDRRVIPNTIDNIERIDIRSDSGFIEIIKNSYLDWNLIQPRKGIIKQIDIMLFIDQLNSYVIYDYLQNNTNNFSLYGLDNNATKINFSNITDNLFSLSIGDQVENNPNYRYAVKNNNNKIFLVSSDIINFIEKSVEKFRKSNVFNFKTFHPKSIFLEDKNHKIHFYSNSNNLWNMKLPFEWSICNNSFNDFINFIENMNITNFNVKLNSDLHSIYLLAESEDSKSQEITFLTSYDENKPLYIKFKDELFMHEINHAQNLHNFMNPLFFKNPKIFSFDSNEITYFEIINNKSSIIDINTIKNPSSIDLDILEFFSNLNADSYIAAYPSSLAAYNLDDPNIIIKFRLHGSSFFGSELLIGNKTSIGRYAMIKGRDIIFIISNNYIEELMKKLERRK